jgi:hypothetical protein
MNSPVFLSFLAPFLNHFVQYKRALNRKYRADAEVLRLFDRYFLTSLANLGISGIFLLETYESSTTRGPKQKQATQDFVGKRIGNRTKKYRPAGIL